MAKEISEEPEAVANTLRGRLSPEGEVTIPELDSLDVSLIDRVIFIACGTAAYAAMLGAYAMEKWSGIPVTVELSHEFRYRDPVVGAGTLVVSVSQSGETMDTLMAVRYANELGLKPWRSATPRARRSLGNPTQPCTPMRDPRWRSPPPKHSFPKPLRSIF